VTTDRTGVPWTRDETLAAFVLYMHLPRGKFHARNADVIALATALGRKPSSVARKLSNIEHFDPNRDKDVVGSSHGSHWEREIWDEVVAHGDDVIGEALSLYRDAMAPSVAQEYDSASSVDVLREGRDVTVTATRRLNQDHFRNLLMELYEEKCCVTGLGVRQLLVASHIKPWRDADPFTERVNVENGLVLNSLHDAAFDKGLITLDRDYRIVMSDGLLRMARKADSEGMRWLMATRGRQIALPRTHRPSQEFLEYHRDVVFGSRDSEPMELVLPQ